jgi:L-malate glycosyltransferase
VSEAIRQILLPAIKHPERVSTIYSGIDLMRFEGLKAKNTLRKELGLPADTVLIGNVSAIAPHKDYFTFVRTAGLLLQNNPDLRFVIIGDGPERSAVGKEIKIRGLEGKIFLTGFRTGIPGLLKELNVLLLTSKTEGTWNNHAGCFCRPAYRWLQQKPEEYPKLLNTRLQACLPGFRMRKRTCTKWWNGAC